MNPILERLEGGDSRSIGLAEEVVQDILKKPLLFSDVFEGIFHPDPVIRMRSADAIEKVSSQQPEYLKLFKKRLLKEVASIDQQEVKWHVVCM